MIAESDGALAGFISGYLIPARPDTLFVWQVAVAPESRGQALGRAMLAALIERDSCASVRFVETSITPENQPSWHTFRRFADAYGAPLSSTPWFSSRTHFESQHDAEHLVRIGPLCRPPQPTPNGTTRGLSNQSFTHPETIP